MPDCLEVFRTRLLHDFLLALMTCNAYESHAVRLIGAILQI